MNKRKIQIAVISIIAVLTLGGAFLNNKYAHVATPQQNKTQVVKKETKKDTVANSKKTAKEKKESLESEKKNENSKESPKDSAKETDTEKKIGDKSVEKATSKAIESAEDMQEEVANSTTKTETKNPVVEHKEEPNAPPATPSQPEPTQPTPENKPTPEPKKEVTFSIKGTASNSSSYFISPQKVGMNEGQSVMDVLSEYCRNNGIQVGIRGGTYVAGINNLYEFDKGAESGWLYRVNGVFPSYGAAQYAVQVGDTIEWMYTENMGKDVGAPQV